MLTIKEKILVEDFLSLRKGQLFQLTELCAYLIENGSTPETFITGKPKLFPYIALIVEREKEKFENVKIEIKEDKTDVMYQFSRQRVKNTETQEKANNQKNGSETLNGKLKQSEQQPKQTQMELF